MITSPIPNQDKLLIQIETLQVLDEGNGIFPIPTIVGHKDKITCQVLRDYVDIRSRRLLESRRFLHDLILALRRP